ncbi:MAG: DUF2652 domain-containing protein [Chloroflexi bacterium]|nr:DUF2652 domain-containing protein [Chloroflexota bacterium]MBI3170040.1 DUF2652 domain-containing protein [Chloroflexota bacterium]
MNETQHGYLLLADITGYTSYVATTELTHSQEILTELLETIIAQFKPLLTISKIEGDAVFAYAPETSIPRGETILELINSTYLAFRSRRDASQRRTTCTCNACRNIPNLDLKFFSHHGEYFVQNISGVRELVGSDVNLIHRLTKNRLAEQTNWRAYVMFTMQGLSHINLPLDSLFEQSEIYEHLGEIHTFSLDLHARYRELIDARRTLIAPASAHVTYEADYDASPSLVWEWFNDPHKRGQWMTSEILPILRIGGRSRVIGARNHCVHGNNQVIVEDVLDIRPYEYVTVRQSPQGSRLALEITFSFAATGENRTHFAMLFKGYVPYAPEWFKKLFCRSIVRTQIYSVWKLESINDLIKGDLAVK